MAKVTSTTTITTHTLELSDDEAKFLFELLHAERSALAGRSLRYPEVYKALAATRPVAPAAPRPKFDESGRVTVERTPPLFKPGGEQI